MTELARRVFSRGGLLAQRFPGYQPRVGQIEMTIGVERAQKDGGNATIEAPTGTGKSVAYLVPSVARAIENERVMVVTAGLALQDQIIGKDAPLLRSVLPEPFTFAVAKGLNNYLCRLNYDDAAAEYGMLGFKEDFEREQWPEIERWVDRTRDGDVAELPFEVDGRLRLKVTTTSDECLGKTCKKHGDCFAMAARKAAKAAQLVVTNYHLFFADLAVKSGDPSSGPLPPYKHVVFDEAHEAAEIARDFFGFRVSPFAVRRAARFLSGKAEQGIPACGPDDLPKRLARASSEFFDQVKAASEHKSYRGRVEAPGLFDPEPLCAQLVRVSQAYGDALGTTYDEAGNAALEAAMLRLEAMREQLRMAAQNHEPGKFVYFIEDQPIAVAMKPIEVGPMLRKHLFEREDVKSVVMTSATLASGTGDDASFDFFREEVGCPPGAAEFAVDSPFDFEKNVLLYLPRLRPEPNDAEYPTAVADVVYDVAMAAGGRTLALFTSFRGLKAAKQHLERMGVPFRVLAHGDAPRMQLVEEFKRDETSVLLGCDSFWQGVDVPGPALSAVVIDKIPFPHHDDPVMGAIQQRNKHWFSERALPSAAIALKQAFGRLIRTTTDRGVVALCDPRLRSKGYGKTLLRALPPGMADTRDLDEVRRFLGFVAPL